MKILAILLLIISVVKLIFFHINKIEVDGDTVSNNITDPNIIRLLAHGFLTADSLLGLLCSLFILFAV